MDDKYLSPFTKSILTGVFVGFVLSIVCLIYNLIYRDSTGFTPSIIINVSSLIFAVNLLFLVLGGIYYAFLRAFKKGDIIYIIVFVLLTIFFIWQAEESQRSTDEVLTAQFRGLLAGIILILGIGASFLIPFLYRNKSFEENVL
ncbi:MAG TPA: hypothetical protein VIQ00_14640 [Chitinophagaceae bacterium]